MRFVLICALIAPLAGCGAIGSLSSGASSPFGQGIRGSATEVDGIRFRSRVRAEERGSRNFTVATAGAQRNVPAALEAGRQRAVEYCLTRFGESDIAWTISPDRPVAEVSIADGGALQLAGACISR
ncbi:hypothetical protein [Jannaschia aquimarina]|uniref:Lipoprotein n=1 Tax=Jannaschia aquimarina TaxID=935700 RepID=A0A0D1EDQ5_9RHOB|nr:hypothetical protein [Jannaschia aquimarina]KIT15809.1 hypothetical protein jaqu_23890 [Jannaschia aquimarina]SNT09110.1 hypothetical protein SAMN05421775_105204 [Jannaschia aquimarina]